jgi:short-subunit dehydrogenase
MPIAVITGASTGIGRELAFECAQDGYDLVLVARSAESLQRVADEVKAKTGRSCQIVPLDLTDPQAPQRLFDLLAPVRPEIEMLINNAGYGLMGFFHELDTTDEVKMVQLNVTALTHLTRLFLPGLIERKRSHGRKGYVMNVGSTAAFQPGPLMAVYYATKAYVVSFSEAVHNEVKDKGVIVTAVCPGATRTEFQKRAGLGGAKLFAGPLVMDAATVAAQGYRAMKAGRSSVVTGMLNSFMALSVRLVPRQFAATMARKVHEAV